MSHSLNVTTPTDLEITMTRVLDAPRDLVFAAHTQAEHLKHWWGRGNPLDVDIDFRVGGRYRFIEHADGQEYAFRGEFLQIDPPSRLVQTFEYEGMPGRVAVETHVFEQRGDQTVVTTTSRFETKADRDGMLDSGMQDGAEQSYRALERYLATLG